MFDAGEAAFHEEAEGADDVVRHGPRAGQGGRFAVRPVHQKPVDGVLLGAEPEEGEQRSVRESRHLGRRDSRT
ncbi:hypothetical protein [Streptomyces sp. NPDC058297]|uniref:hypothetical protein n=1 Tax=unclassified Streptomyces TaxID=2593676 RepID=UPI0036E5F622